MSQKARVWARLLLSFIAGLVPMVVDKLSGSEPLEGRTLVIFSLVLLMQAGSIFTAWMTKSFEDAKADQARIDIEDAKITQDIKVERKDSGLPASEVKP